METARKRATVLFVDDERRVLTSMRAMFRRDYEVLLANSGAEALELLRDHDVDVIVSDQRMPGMTGVEVLKAVKDLAPNAMRILLTGYADLKAIEASINEGEVFRYLTKPCPSDQLREAIGLAADIASGGQPAERPIERAAPQLGNAGARSADARAIARPVEVAANGAFHSPKPAATPPHAHAQTKTVDAVGAARAHLTPIARRTTQRDARDVEVLVLSNDTTMVQSIESALDGSHALRRAHTLEQAVAALEAHPIGVLVTDTAISEAQIATLTTTLKRHVPELVTIVASGRSDAQLLIDLINYGQIFRFLLKPLHGGQCRLSVESAVSKHCELAADPSVRRRHAVAERDAPTESVVHAVFDRIRRLRDRFLASHGMAS